MVKDLELLQEMSEGKIVIEGLEGLKFRFGSSGDGKWLNILEGTAGALANFPCFLCEGKQVKHEITPLGKMRSDNPKINPKKGQVIFSFSPIFMKKL